MRKYLHRANLGVDIQLETLNKYDCLEIDVQMGKNGIEVKHNWYDIGMQFNQFLQYCSGKELAINVKQNGLCQELMKNIKDYEPLLGLKDYFFFDMSVPDTLDYLKNVPEHTAIRTSEYEIYDIDNDKYILDKVGWVWYDQFNNHEKLIDSLIDDYEYLIHDCNKKVVVVHPELHGSNVKMDLKEIEEMGVYGICMDTME